jgi:hypothetical protein
MRVAPVCEISAGIPGEAGGTSRALAGPMQQNPYQASYGQAQQLGQSPQAYGPAPQQYAPAAQTGYEFTSQENATIGGAASWTKAAGIIQAIVGGLMMLGGVAALLRSGAAGIVNIATALIPLVVGISLVSAAGSLSRVVTTQGSDIAHMMEAMKAYERAFKIQVIIVAVAFFIGIIAGILGAMH